MQYLECMLAFLIMKFVHIYIESTDNVKVFVVVQSSVHTVDHNRVDITAQEHSQFKS